MSVNVDSVRTVLLFQNHSDKKQKYYQARKKTSDANHGMVTYNKIAISIKAVNCICYFCFFLSSLPFIYLSYSHTFPFAWRHSRTKIWTCNNMGPIQIIWFSTLLRNTHTHTKSTGKWKYRMNCKQQQQQKKRIRAMKGTLWMRTKKLIEISCFVKIHIIFLLFISSLASSFHKH